MREKISATHDVNSKIVPYPVSVLYTYSNYYVTITVAVIGANNIVLICFIINSIICDGYGTNNPS